MSEPVRWPDPVQRILEGDIVAALAYTTAAGGAVAIPLSPFGAVDRKAGSMSFSTGLAWHRKLSVMLRRPQVTLAFHTRRHGLTQENGLVLVQGLADVPVAADPAQAAAHWERFAGFANPLPRGRVWDWLLREYQDERADVGVRAERVAFWPETDGTGPVTAFGAPWPAQMPEPQWPPSGGTGPRIAERLVRRKMRPLTHRLLAYRGSDGFPVVAPVTVTAIESGLLRLSAPPGLLPPGGRRAGFTAHGYGAGLIGIATQVCTGWLEAGEDGTATYAVHTQSGFTAPPNETVQLIASGILQKRDLRQARRSGALNELARLKEETTARGASVEAN
jgi:hypothetical protein